ncbi:MAG: glutaredoxin family protein [Planctomycetota bacterium]|nr:glutaredoxin family protein [Planctomycetota bacterium]
MAYHSKSREQELNDRFQAWLGTGMMCSASLFAVLIFCDRMEIRLFTMPAVWDTSRGMHLFLCCGMFVFAAILLKSPQNSDEPESTTPLFRTCEMLTRPGCELCDEALGVLIGFQNALPPIVTTDITNNPQLTRQFGESIPVVLLDGRVRFRGAVDPLLMQRLVDAAHIRRRYADLHSDEHHDASSGLVTS